MDNTLYLCLELLLAQHEKMLAIDLITSNKTIWLSGGQRSGKTSLPLVYKRNHPNKKVAVVAYTAHQRNTLSELYNEIEVINNDYEGVKLDTFDIIFLDDMDINDSEVLKNYNHLMEVLDSLSKDIPVVAMPFVL